jgi:hypothetical protein
VSHELDVLVVVVVVVVVVGGVGVGVGVGGVAVVVVARDVASALSICPGGNPVVWGQDWPRTAGSPPCISSRANATSLLLLC